MDLRDFSADVQNLTIKMIYVGANISNKKTEHLRAFFVRDDELSGTMVAAGFFMRQTWEMLGTKKGDKTARLTCKATEYRAGLEFEKSAGLEQDIYQEKPRPMLHEANGRHFAAFTATAHVRRFQWYFFTNVTFPVGLISGLSLVQFSVPPDESGGRVDITLVLLLTLAAYKQLAAQMVPQVDYMTKLDKYIMANFVLCALNVVAAGTLQHAAEDDVSGRPVADLAVLGVLSAVWLLIQACYTVSMHIAWQRSMQPMQKAEATEKEEATAR